MAATVETDFFAYVRSVTKYETGDRLDLDLMYQLLLEFIETWKEVLAMLDRPVLDLYGEKTNTSSPTCEELEQAVAHAKSLFSRVIYCLPGNCWDGCTLITHEQYPTYVADELLTTILKRDKDTLEWCARFLQIAVTRFRELLHRKNHLGMNCGAIQIANGDPMPPTRVKVLTNARRLIGDQLHRLRSVVSAENKQRQDLFDVFEKMYLPGRIVRDGDDLWWASNDAPFYGLQPVRAEFLIQLLEALGGRGEHTQRLALQIRSKCTATRERRARDSEHDDELCEERTGKRLDSHSVASAAQPQQAHPLPQLFQGRQQTTTRSATLLDKDEVPYLLGEAADGLAPMRATSLYQPLQRLDDYTIEFPGHFRIALYCKYRQPVDCVCVQMCFTNLTTEEQVFIRPKVTHAVSRFLLTELWVGCEMQQLYRPDRTQCSEGITFMLQPGEMRAFKYRITGVADGFATPVPGRKYVLQCYTQYVGEMTVILELGQGGAVPALADVSAESAATATSTEHNVLTAFSSVGRESKLLDKGEPEYLSEGAADAFAPMRVTRLYQYLQRLDDYTIEFPGHFRIALYFKHRQPADALSVNMCFTNLRTEEQVFIRPKLTHAVSRFLLTELSAGYEMQELYRPGRTQCSEGITFMLQPGEMRAFEYRLTGGVANGFATPVPGRKYSVQCYTQYVGEMTVIVDLV